MAVQYQPERGERPEDFTDERCLELVRKGAGRSDIEAVIVDARPWEVAAYVADRYRAGRAFIIGDAAHLMPPTGGFGGNTGIHDAHNLTWKLDMVVRGAAGSALLDTYESERKPVAERTLAQALARLQAWFRDPSKKLPPAEAILEDENVVFGYAYGVGALIPQHGSSGGTFENPRQSSGRPGSRAPNLAIRRGETLTTLYDLCQGDWVLLAGPTGQPWCLAANSIGIRCLCVDVDFADLGGRWSSAYGVMSDGAALIRPDNHVAWRATKLIEDPGAKLRDAFERVTCQRSPLCGPELR